MIGTEHIMTRKQICFFSVFLFFLFLTGCKPEHYDFEERLEKLRAQLHIPGMSTAVSREGTICWSSSFGYADVQKRIPATDSTIYHLASLTKPFASVVVMQLVEKGKINLDDPLSKYDIKLDEARRYGLDVSNSDKIRVRHLLTHTAQGEPGTRFVYSGYMYGLLDSVIMKSSGRSFVDLLIENVLRPLELNHTIPNIRDTLAFSKTGKHLKDVIGKVYIPYQLDSLTRPVPAEMETYFGPSAGLMSTTTDMIRFSEAIYDNKLLNSAIWSLVFTPYVSVRGDTLPYALGWFVQKFQGLTLQWHYGYWNTNSSLIIRIPEKKMTFVVLAATSQLSRPFSLGDGNVLVSPLATAFLREFVFPDRQIPEINLDNNSEEIISQLASIKASAFKSLVRRETLAQAAIASMMGQSAKAQKYYSTYAQLYMQPIEKFYPGPVIAEIASAGDSVYEMREFTLRHQTTIEIVAIGEGIGNQMYDYGWLENASGDTLWKMTMEKTEHAGGGRKNRISKISRTLNQGTYRIGYRTDESHSYNRWNTMPPDINYYGIRVIED
jgi:CubicO group peptidase (beta-lactamase class C family)